MGWGTFIAGRLLRTPKKQMGVIDMLDDAMKQNIRRKTAIETEVLKEIKRLKSEGKDVDVNAVRVVIQNRIKGFKRLGPRLELEIIQKAQQKALAGEEVNYAQIEREILDTPKKNSARKFTLPKNINSLGLYEDDSLPPEKVQIENATRDTILGLLIFGLGILVIGLLLW